MKAPTRELLLADVLSDLTWKEIADKYGYTDPRFLRKLARRYDLPPRRTILKPTEAELRKMILAEGLTPYEVADKLGYGEGGWSNIYKYCRDYGIEFDFSKNHDLRAVPFTQRQKEITLASLLGDGYLHPTGKGSYYLTFTHGEKQKAYLEWKLSEFENFVATKEFYRRESTSNLGHAPIYSFSTISHPYLLDVRALCYPDGKKRVTREWLGQLSPLSLAVWYMDDGSRHIRTNVVTLCTNAFSFEEHQIMADWFMEKWGIKATICSSHKTQYNLRINQSQVRRFYDLVAPHIPDCMSYKLG